MDSLYFSFNGHSSEEYNIILVKVEAGLIEESFASNRELIEDVLPNGKIYHYGVKKNPLEISVTFMLKEGYYWDDDTRRRVAQWLYLEQYSPFYSTDNVNRIYYVIAEGDSQRFHNGCQEGYITLKFKCLYPYALTPKYEESFNCSPNSTSIDISTNNIGDDICYPVMWLTKIGDGDVRIQSLTDGNVDFIVTGLKNNEMIYVNHLTQEIISDLYDGADDTFLHYDDCNDNFIYLRRGTNNFRVYGACTLKFQYEYILKGG